MRYIGTVYSVICVVPARYTMNVCIVICVVSAREGPGIACYLEEKHPVHVWIVICVASVRKAPTLRLTSARSTPWTYISLFVWLPNGRLVWFPHKGTDIAFYLDETDTMNVCTFTNVFPDNKAPALRVT